MLAVLAARGVPISEELRTQLRGCADAQRLDRWLARAATVRDGSELSETEAAHRHQAIQAGADLRDLGRCSLGGQRVGYVLPHTQSGRATQNRRWIQAEHI